MTDLDFELTARVLVDQHYAAGPDKMRRVFAQALRDAAAGRQAAEEEPRARLLKEVDEATKASCLGSE